MYKVLRWIESEGKYIESEVNLKPCPICGGTGRLFSSVESWVECEQCHARTDMKNCDEHAIDDWQRNFNVSKEKSKDN